MNETASDGWQAMLARLAQDARRLRRYQEAKFGYRPLTWFLDPGWVCVLLFRLSHLLYRRGWHKLARLLMQLNSLMTAADIHPASEVGGGLLIPSPCGVNISGRAGDNLAVLALAGIGGSVRDADIGAGIGLPLVGRDVTVNWFTGVQGSITVADGVVFGPSVGAVAHVPPGTHMSLRLPPIEGAWPQAAAPRERMSPPCPHASWHQMRTDMAADVDRYLAERMAHAPPGSRPPPRLSAMLTNPVLALAVYRLSHWLHANGWRRTALILCQCNIVAHKLTIPPASCLGGGVLMPHLGGTLFAGRAGQRLTLYAGALCACQGGALAADAGQTPILGDDVLVAGHAAAIGPVTIGDGAQFGPKAQLMEDLEAGAQVWDPLARGSAHPPNEPPTDLPRSIASPPSHPLSRAHPWRDSWHRLRRDRQRLGATPCFPALAAVALHRLSHACFATVRRRPARWAWLANIYLTGADIAPDCEIGAGLLMPHPAGIALQCRAGEDLTLGALSGITAPLGTDGRPAPLDDCPLLGDRVQLAHHGGISGAVVIGDDVLVQPGCVATRSVPSGAALLPRKLRFRRRATVESIRARTAGHSREENK